MKNKKSVAKSASKTLTAEEILQAIDSIEITPMKETQKETEKKETEKDTQQEKETVKGKQQVKRKGKVAKSGPSTPAKKDRTDSSQQQSLPLNPSLPRL